METTTELALDKPVITENTALAKVLNNSGLQLNEAETIKQSYLPYFEQMAEIKDQASKINFVSPTDIDEKIARELRLKLVKIRTGSMQVKDERKRIHLLKGNVEQQAWNLIKATCELDEEMFLQVEKAREIAVAKEKEALKAARMELLAPFENTAAYTAVVADMSNEAFNDLLKGLELAKEAKVQAEAKAEVERLAKEQEEAAQREAQRIENENLKAEQARDKARNEELRPYVVFIRDYNTMLALAEPEYQKSLADIKRAAKDHYEYEAKEAAKQKAIADAERAKQEELLEAQRKKAATESAAREKAEKEAADLKAKEAKRIADEEAAKQAEEKALAFAAKKAATASDKEKLARFVFNIQAPARPTGMNNESDIILKEIQSKLDAFKKWADEQINTL